MNGEKTSITEIEASIPIFKWKCCVKTLALRVDLRCSVTQHMINYFTDFTITLCENH